MSANLLIQQRNFYSIQRTASIALAAFACLWLALAQIRAAEPMRVWVEQCVADLEAQSAHQRLAGDSEEALRAEHLLYDTWLKKIATLDFATLSEDDQVDAVLLRNHLQRLEFEREEDLAERQELAPWLSFRAAIDALMDARVRGEKVVPEQAAVALAKLAKVVEDAHQALISSAPEAAAHGTPSSPDRANSSSKPTAEQAQRLSQVASELGHHLSAWYKEYEGFLPEFDWWVKQPYGLATKALESYSHDVREKIAGLKGEPKDPLLGKPIGAAALQKHLGYQFIPYTPEELIALAEREFAWCEGEMKRASHAMGLGDDWKAALSQVKQKHVPPGQQEETVRAIGRETTAYIKEHHLVTVPEYCEQWWGTHMLNPEEQRTLPYAAYNGKDILVAYAHQDMSQEEKEMTMRGNNPAFMHNVIPHELIPGHHLQHFWAERYRPYRQTFSTPFFVEGWALYWEMRLYGLGFQATPEQRIGALFWRMHRCARILVTLRFHLGQMKPEEMVKFLVERVGHEEAGARSEVRRYLVSSPLYQCSYMLGGLQLRALHEEMTQDKGSDKDKHLEEQAFHDAVLQLGPIPVELIRATLEKQPLTGDFKTQWRFDDRPQ